MLEQGDEDPPHRDQPLRAVQVGRGQDTQEPVGADHQHEPGDRLQRSGRGLMPPKKTPRQKKADKLAKAVRNRIRTCRGDGQDRDPKTVSVTDDRASAQDDQSNLIYVGGNYMGSPDYQESYQQAFHEQVIQRWLETLPKISSK